MPMKSPTNSLLVAVGLGGRVRHPDVGKRHEAQDRHVRHDADDGKRWPSTSIVLPDRRLAAEEALPRGLVDHRDHPARRRRRPR